MPFLTRFPLPALRHDIQKLAITFSIAALTGWIFLALNFPAPFLMGSVFGVWFIGGSVKPLHPYLGVARWFHIPVVLGLGVFIGSFFQGDLIGHVIAYTPTVLAMIAVTIVVTIIGFLFLTRVRKYEPVMAILCAIPGGQAEAIVMARELVEKDYVVALFHLMRVCFVFITTPLLLAAIQGQNAVEHSNELLKTMPGLFDLSLFQFSSFIALAVGGLLLARLIRLPMPHLLGPVLLSAGCHAANVVHIPRIFEFVMLAQLAIGGGVGARLAQVNAKELMVYLKDAAINTMMILLLYFSAAVTIAYFLGATLLEVWLAFVPGGLYEVTLLAMIFGFDIAFIAFHHTIRVILIFLAMPSVVMRFQRKS
jgi:membrane AbrB-like protein